ncbi:hypothetical protein MLD63_00410 (plasmid) [Paracoccus sp. TK19116]|uniref:Uncharacterized protein n=1 Tax=Paracoccus albicereus TaxID=2922394 RepID=A0ABT1MN66_9RHOB|nr:hypothetical protein [Paracoccus albicereus]MCQ0968898.1 hypothetical protein [Paracoccus albicereus]
MTALIRLILVVILIEGVFYILLSLYIRSLRRERLEEHWDLRHPHRAGDSPDRREFVDRGVARFRKSLQSRLLLLVFVLPTLAIMVIVWLVNWQ